MEHMMDIRAVEGDIGLIDALAFAFDHAYEHGDEGRAMYIFYLLEDKISELVKKVDTIIAESHKEAAKT